MDYEQIRFDVEDHILTITLNRPDKLNACTNGMIDELVDALDRADADDDVRAIIFTGAGRGFCAGADLSNGASTFRLSSQDTNANIRPDGGGLLTLRLFDCLKPVIAACNGPAAGVGATMQLAMDVRLASTEARYGFVFARRGIVPEAASSWFLPRIVGISQALEWSFSGRVFGAEEALAGGLVKSVHQPDELMPAARELARTFVEGTSSVSVALIRQMMWKMLTEDHPVIAHNLDSRGVYHVGQSADAAEGVRSFLEKRTPSFPNLVSRDMPPFFPWWEKRAFK